MPKKENAYPGEEEQDEYQKAQAGTNQPNRNVNGHSLTVWTITSVDGGISD